MKKAASNPNWGRMRVIPHLLIPRFYWYTALLVYGVLLQGHFALGDYKIVELETGRFSKKTVW